MRGLRGLCVFDEHLPFFVTSGPAALYEIATAWFRRRATERTTGTRIIKLIAPCEHSRRLPLPARFENNVAWNIFSSPMRRQKASSTISSRTSLREETFLSFFFFFKLPDRDSYLSFRVCRVLSRLPDRISLEVYRSSPLSLNIVTLGHVDFSLLDAANFSKILS